MTGRGNPQVARPVAKLNSISYPFSPSDPANKFSIARENQLTKKRKNPRTPEHSKSHRQNNPGTPLERRPTLSDEGHIA